MVLDFGNAASGVCLKPITAVQRNLPFTSGGLREVHLSASQTAVVNFTSAARAVVRSIALANHLRANLSFLILKQQHCEDGEV